MWHVYSIIIYAPTMGRAKTQPTEGFRPYALHHHLANINGQWCVYCCGEHLGPLQFLGIFHSHVAYYFSFK
jgi:hypothetical protein